MAAALKAVGIHVFAGAFTHGVNQVFDVQCQLEKHNFGRESCEGVFNVPFINHKDAHWPDVEAQFCYGNPRCTGFSCITSGYDEDTHGAWSKPTKDIHELCEYAVGKYDIIIWESVQQAYTTGRELLDYLRDEIFVPKHYRIAHIMCCAASVGNCQKRKRYFFVAYRDDRNFNIVPPELPEYEPTLYDAIWHLKDNETHAVRFRDGYDFNSYALLTPNERECIPFLPSGWGLNTLAKYNVSVCPPGIRTTWNLRSSSMPFSMHCITRMNWRLPCSTLHSSASRFIHPHHHRPLTVGELSTIMGWPDIPKGEKPVAQIAKGVVPDVGKWLAEQALMYLNNEWGDQDWESRYNPAKCMWEGGNAHGQVEKVFHLTNYISNGYDESRFKDVPKPYSYDMEYPNVRFLPRC